MKAVRGLRCLAMVMLLILGGMPALTYSESIQPVEDWQTIIRSAPYWSSQGVYSNILDIRRWVLGESSYCSDPERHLLFDHRGKFLGYTGNASDSETTQKRLNQQREKLARQGRATGWTPGDASTTGYPFALACNQPHARLDEAMDRYLGKTGSDRLWGRWDDLDFASEDAPGTLHNGLRYVFDTRREQQRLSLPDELPRYMAGMLLIESGGRTRAHSASNAKGIMQLTPRVLSDCGVASRNYWHRLAQLDCAMKLMSQNARNLEPAINEHFSGLPQAKRERLFTLLLIQAYHGGASRIKRLLEDEDLNGPARYFAEHHDRFTAGDIAFGMVFHNLGRDRLGLASLYYVADVELATQAICDQPAIADTPFCDPG